MLPILRRVSCVAARATRRYLSSAAGAAAAGPGSGQGTIEQHAFKAETRRLLDIVANSLYTDKEVFVRELISNASDALEKLRFLSSQAGADAASANEALKISISVNEAENTFTIQDTGVGMTREELIANLGTIAHSGTREFSASNDSKLIGRFGVGFYATFVVADKVEVVSRKAGETAAHRWTSDGHGSFTVEEITSDGSSLQTGTTITLHLKPECADFARVANVKTIVHKFSSFVDFPIFLTANTATAAAGVDEKMQTRALWLQTSATPEEHVDFFRHLTGSAYEEPLYSLLYHTDAPLSIKAALYVVSEPPPADAPGASASAGVSLYANRVLVQKEASALLPGWMRGWVRGVVDCEDSVSLNVSREHMQDSQALKKLSSALVRKVLRFLIDEAAKDPVKYNDIFYVKFGAFLKAGLLEDARLNNAAHKDLIAKLLRFPTLHGQATLVSLDAFVESQQDASLPLYYVVAPDRATAAKSPYLEGLGAGDALVFSEEIDEYVANFLGAVKGRRLVNVAAAGAASTTGGEAATSDAHKLLQTFVQRTLGADLVDKVVFSSKLVSSPAVVSSQISPNMRKMMKQMIQAQAGAPAAATDLLDGIPVTLELNPNHTLVQRLATLAASADPAQVNLATVATTQLFHNALIAAGLLHNPQLILDNLHVLLDLATTPVQAQ